MTANGFENKDITVKIRRENNSEREIGIEAFCLDTFCYHEQLLGDDLYTVTHIPSGFSVTKQIGGLSRGGAREIALFMEKTCGDVKDETFDGARDGILNKLPDVLNTIREILKEKGYERDLD